MNSYKHQYKGYGVHPSECLIKIVREDLTYILFEDLGIGTSVTNASEQLATEIVKTEGLDESKCRFFETYNYDSQNNDIDEITYEWNNKKAKNPKWNHIKDKEIYKKFER